MKRGHTIVIKANADTTYNIKDADIAIDFSLPNVAFNNIANCINNNDPVISGTTGWLNDYNKIETLCKTKQGSFIYASNFSLGVTIFFELNKTLAKMMSSLQQYNVSMEEIHHTEKLDAPSGTAITLAEGIILNTDKKAWKLDEGDNDTIAITAKRIGKVPGTHTVTYTSEIDDIEIKHTAHNRQGFSLGAVVAAEWLKDKTGIFTMKDVLGL